MPIDINENTIRIRQHAPELYIRFRIKDLGKGIKAVIGFKKGGGSEIQSYIFDKDKWLEAEAKKWVAEHKASENIMDIPRFIFDLPVELKEMPDGEYKSTIPLARQGKWKHPEYGEFEISPKDLSEIEANFMTARESQPPVNYEHGEGVDSSIGAAGWVQKIWREDGKLLGEVFWTSEGWKKIQDGAFKYISPEIRFHYKDKENGKDRGTVLIGAALTTKPWIEDLVIDLSEKFSEILTLASLSQALDLQDVDKNKIVEALKEFLAQYNVDVPEIRQKLDILRLIMRYISDGTYLSSTKIDEAMKLIEELKGKEWSTSYINDLPDSSFAFIESGGEKDAEGKTTPRSLRHFPYKDADGKIDLPHLRNALARAPQSPFGEKAMPKLKTAAKSAGVGEYGKEKKGGENEMDIKILIEKLKLNESATEEAILSAIDVLLSKPNIDLAGLRQKLELAEDADLDKIIEAVGRLQEAIKKPEKKELSEQVASLSETVKDLTTRLSESEKKYKETELTLREKNFEMDFGERLRKGIALPKMKGWAKALYLSDIQQYVSVMDSMPVMVSLNEIGLSDNGAVDAVKKFNDRITQLQNERKLSYREAIIILGREMPELWEEYQAATKGGSL
jgi:phage I-like protein